MDKDLVGQDAISLLFFNIKFSLIQNIIQLKQLNAEGAQNSLFQRRKRKFRKIIAPKVLQNSCFQYKIKKKILKCLIY